MSYRILFAVSVFPLLYGSYALQCKESEFKCVDESKCILSRDFCNDRIDCADGSDEIFFEPTIHADQDGSACVQQFRDRTCLLPPGHDVGHFCFEVEKECMSEWFICANGKNCVHRESFCDGEHRYCSDGSDEVLYNASIHTAEDGIPCRGWWDLTKVCLLPAAIADRAQFICNTEIKCDMSNFRCSDMSKCIAKEDYCDGHPHCSDGSDEIVYDPTIHTEKDGVSCYIDEWQRPACLLPPGNLFICDPVSCTEDQFKCKDNRQCVSARNFCDENIDCLDGSDEIMYNPKKHTNQDGISCQNKDTNRVCLLPKNHDDSHFCFNVQRDCKPDWFICASRTQCFDRKWFCDGHVGCRDGSDEVVFDESKHKRRHGVACRGWKNLTRVCLLPRANAKRESQVCNEEKACEDGQFKCIDKSACVQKQNFCNGHLDCRDGSDEVVFKPGVHGYQDGVDCAMRDTKLSCYLDSSSGLNPYDFCDRVQCTKNRFKCADGSQCILSEKFCNERIDCADGSDEVTFDPTVHTENDGTACHQRYSDRTCLLPPGHDNEQYCFEVENVCLSEWFICKDRKNCVYRESFCDGVHRYCSDGSDEVLYNASIHTAEDGVPCRGWRDLTRVCLLPAAIADRAQFICNTEIKCDMSNFRCSDMSKCISKEDYCDGYPDCSDGSDEIAYNSTIHTKEDGISCYIGEWERPACLLPPGNLFLCDPVVCSEDEFVCDNAKQCIPKQKFCDLEPDCSDGSDEKTFDPTTDNHACRSFTKVDHVCTFRRWVQERVCNEECTEDSFMCSDKSKCIPKHKFCDSKKDCPDGSDELKYKKYIGEGMTPCRSWTFLRNRCVLPLDQENKRDKICNPENRCGDGYFKCTKMKQCIPAEQFCDGMKNCRDGSDESFFDPYSHTMTDGVSCKRGELKCLIPNRFKFNSFWNLPCDGNSQLNL